MRSRANKGYKGFKLQDHVVNTAWALKYYQAIYKTRT